MIDLKRYKDEEPIQYQYRISKQKDLIGTWQDVADAVNAELGWEYSESKYRKDWNGFNSLLEVHQQEVFDSEEAVADIKEQREYLEKEKVKFRDERNEYNRLLRESARSEVNWERLKDYIHASNHSPINVPVGKPIKSNNDMLVMLSDFHIGQTFDNCWGKYNSDIAKERLGKYLSEVIDTQMRYGSQDCYVAILGDLISGGLHPSIKVSDRENIIQQVIICSELILGFVLELAKHFKTVKIAAVNGNHSRIEPKEKAILGERLDEIIAWYVESHIGDSKNIIMQKSPYDGTLNVMNIRGKKYVLCHGDYDNFTKGGISNLAMMINEIPYACLFGHLHTNAFQAENVMMIRGGTLAGSGNQYTVEKRLNGKPGQMMCVVNEQGVKALMPVELS